MKLSKWIILVVTFAALVGVGAWWTWFRPSPLEKARAAMNAGDAASAARILTQRLTARPLDTAEELDLRRELARALIMQRAYTDADVAIRALLERVPDDAFGQEALGFVMIALNREDDAVEPLRRAKKIAPDNLRPSYALMTIFNLRGDFDAARAEALDILNRNPTDETGRMGLGTADLNRGLFLDAAQTFETLLDTSPDNNDARAALALARTRAGAPNEATSPTRRNADASSDNTFLSMEKNPDAATIAAARQFARQGDVTQAQSLLMDVAPRLPKPEDVAAPSPVDFYQPWSVMDKRRAARALRAAFHRAMADTYSARYMTNDAERALRLALQLEPASIETLSALTDLKRRTGDAADYVAEARRAVELFPAHPTAILDLARALTAAKKTGEALGYAQAVVAACPDLSRAHAVLADVHLATGDKKAAAEEAATALQKNDRDSEAWIAAGFAAKADGKIPEAEKNFTRALALDPFSARAHAALADVLDARNNRRDARTHRERAVELEPRVYAR